MIFHINFLFLSFLFQGCKNVTNTAMPCLAHEYQCKDRITCLHSSWLCDGERDCPDGDDEVLSNCKNRTCRTDQFQCTDRSCIAGHLTCNGQFDCADKSDELNCGKSEANASFVRQRKFFGNSNFLLFQAFVSKLFVMSKLISIVVVGNASPWPRFVTNARTVPMVKMNRPISAELMSVPWTMVAVCISVWTSRWAIDVNVKRGRWKEEKL